MESWPGRSGAYQILGPQGEDLGNIFGCEGIAFPGGSWKNQTNYPYWVLQLDDHRSRYFTTARRAFFAAQCIENGANCPRFPGELQIVPIDEVIDAIDYEDADEEYTVRTQLSAVTAAFNRLTDRHLALLDDFHNMVNDITDLMRGTATELNETADKARALYDACEKHDEEMMQ